MFCPECQKFGRSVEMIELDLDQFGHPDEVGFLCPHDATHWQARLRDSLRQCKRCGKYTDDESYYYSLCQKCFFREIEEERND